MLRWARAYRRGASLSMGACVGRARRCQLRGLWTPREEWVRVCLCLGAALLELEDGGALLLGRGGGGRLAVASAEEVGGNAVRVLHDLVAEVAEAVELEEVGRDVDAGGVSVGQHEVARGLDEGAVERRFDLWGPWRWV